MNPDTKLTVAQIKKICQKHSIEYVSHSRITTGFSHEVHRLNDDLIIKIFNSDAAKKFNTEVMILSSILPFPKPKQIASDAGDTIGRSYIIMSFVPGVSLGSAWHKANEVQRENLIKDISSTLININKIEPLLLSSDQADNNWRNLLLQRAEQLVATLVEKQTLDQVLADKTLRFFRENAVALEDSQLLAVYWDIHFDNFVVNENFELQAIIDLENVELAPLDYPLFVIQKMTDEPEKYLSEVDEKYADKRDYVNLKDWYKKYYPQMFAFENLDTRVALYQILDTLHLLVDWSHVKSLHVKLDSLISH